MDILKKKLLGKIQFTHCKKVKMYQILVNLYCQLFSFYILNGQNKNVYNQLLYFLQLKLLSSNKDLIS